MLLIGADDEISEQELEAVTDAAQQRFGEQLAVGEATVIATKARQRIEKIGARAFLDEILPVLPRDEAHAVLRAGMSIARSDSFAAQEREVLRLVARELGLQDPFQVTENT
jgi:tellurite resistance protein